MKKINVISDYPTISVQIFDRYYAYRQSVNQKHNYKSDVDIVFSNIIKSDCTNVLLSHMPDAEINYDAFDFVFFDNGGEPIEVMTSTIKQQLDNDIKNKCYFITGSIVDDDFLYADKIISYNASVQQFIRYHTEGFYPQYYDKKQFEHLAREGMCFINGQNRSWRNHLMELIKTNLPNIDIYSNISKNVVETITPEFADMHDKVFSKFLKKHVSIIDEISRQDYNYKSIQVGIDEKFGLHPLGFFLLEHYFKYDCIIFPETTCLNNQIFMTEKIFKCFLAECIPFPVGGANINYLYNKVGFKTAWNLLPEDLQSFDQELNHIKRYGLIVEALKWFTKNQNIFQSDQAQKIKVDNKVNILYHNLDYNVVEKLDKIFGYTK